MVRSYIYLNTYLKKVKINFEKDFFKLLHNAIFRKSIENVRKHRDFKLVTTEARRNYLVSEPICHIKKSFTNNLLTIEMMITQM